MKPSVILDMFGRTRNEIFSEQDFAELASFTDIVWARDEPMPSDQLKDALRGAEVLVSARPAIGAAELASAPSLRAVIEVAGGFPPSIDYEACFARGLILLSSAPGFRQSVAEMVLTMALAGARGLVREHEAFRRGSEIWMTEDGGDFTLYGQSVGFVGFGSIARECCRLMNPFAPVIRAYDPFVGEADLRAQNALPCDLPELFSNSRIVVVAATPTRDNRGLVSRELIARMPQSSLLVLISRSHLVDFPAVIEAARSGRITAAVDVFPTEPVPAGDPVRTVANLILSPHRGAAVPAGRQLIGRMIVEDMRAILSGAEPTRLQRATAALVQRNVGA